MRGVDSALPAPGEGRVSTRSIGHPCDDMHSRRQSQFIREMTASCLDKEGFEAVGLRSWRTSCQDAEYRGRYVIMVTARSESDENPAGPDDRADTCITDPKQKTAWLLRHPSSLFSRQKHSPRPTDAQSNPLIHENCKVSEDSRTHPIVRIHPVHAGRRRL